MSRIRSFLVAMLALVCFTTMAAAQTQTANNDATVSITANLTLFGGHALDFGAHFASEGVISSSGSQYAQWTGFTDPGNRFAFDVVLPTALQKVGGSGNGDVPFSCGDAALWITNTTLNSLYDPHSPGSFGPVTPPGDYAVRLGWAGGLPGDPRAQCSVDLTGRAAGTYSGTITLTITII